MVGRAVPSPNRRYRRVWPPRTKGQHLSKPICPAPAEAHQAHGCADPVAATHLRGLRDARAMRSGVQVGADLQPARWLVEFGVAPRDELDRADFQLQCDSAGASRRRRGVRSPRPARHRPSSRSPGTHTGGLVSRPVRGGTALLGRCDVDPLDPSATSPLTSTGAPDPQARRRPAPPGTTPCFAR